MVHITAQDEFSDYSSAPLAAGGMDERGKADKIIADFASALSLDMDFEQTDDAERKWPASWTIAFSLGVSLLLWGVLAGVIYFL